MGTVVLFVFSVNSRSTVECTVLIFAVLDEEMMALARAEVTVAGIVMLWKIPVVIVGTVFIEVAFVFVGTVFDAVENKIVGASVDFKSIALVLASVALSVAGNDNVISEFDFVESVVKSLFVVLEIEGTLVVDNVTVLL